jgi:hypothetical protein
MSVVTDDAANAEPYQPYAAIRHYWWVVVALIIVGAGAVAGGGAARPTSFSSTSTVSWNPNFRADLPALNDSPDSSGQSPLDVATAAVSVRGDDVMAAAGAATGVAVDDLRDDTTVASSAVNDTITITVTGPSADEARTRTGAVANSFVEVSREKVLATLRAQATQVAKALESVSGLTAGETADLRSNEALLAAAASSANSPASVVERATKPVNQDKVARNIAIGAALGLILGVLVALGLGARARRGREAGRSRVVGSTRRART